MRHAVGRSPDGTTACRHQRVKAALLLLALLLLVSCRVPGAVRPVVRIGLVAPFEGRYRYVGYDVFPAVRLALRQVNADGGVLGYAVELVAYDDGADPQMAREQARKLALDPQVVVAMGHFGTATTAAALPDYRTAGLPLVVPPSYEPAPPPDAGLFPLGADAEALATALLDGLDEAVLISEGGPLEMALRARAGFPMAVVSPAEAASLAAADPPVVLLDADPVGAGEALAALRAAGWRGEARGGPALGAGDFAAVAGEAAQDVCFVAPWPSDEDTGFAAAYREVSGGPGPGPLAHPAYDATLRVLEGLRADIAAHGAPSRAGMMAALAALWADQEPAAVEWYCVQQ